MQESINFLIYNTNNSNHWAEDWKRLYAKHLRKLGYSVENCNKVTGKTGWLLMSHYSEMERFLEETDTSGVRVICQSNGTAINPFIYQITEESEKEFLTLCDINICASSIHAHLMTIHYKLPNIYHVGFPVKKSTSTFVKEGGLFIIAGRLTPDKCVYESIREAFKHPSFKRLIICYPQGQQKHLKYYPKNDLIEYKCCSNKELLDLMGRAEYYVNFSLGDTSSVTTVEAIHQDCELLLRNNYPWLIPYYDYNVKNMDDYEPHICAKNLVNVIKQNL